MPGVKTNIFDIMADAMKMQRAMQAAEARKKSVIDENTQLYMRRGIPQYRARLMAEQQYNIIHLKNNNNGKSDY